MAPCARPFQARKARLCCTSHKCRNWAAQVGELKISDDGPNPVISCHLVGVDTDGILANAQNMAIVFTRPEAYSMNNSAWRRPRLGYYRYAMRRSGVGRSAPVSCCLAMC